MPDTDPAPAFIVSEPFISEVHDNTPVVTASIFFDPKYHGASRTRLVGVMGPMRRHVGTREEFDATYSAGVDAFVDSLLDSLRGPLVERLEAQREAMWELAKP